MRRPLGGIWDAKTSALRGRGRLSEQSAQDLRYGTRTRGANNDQTRNPSHSLAPCLRNVAWTSGFPSASRE
jgi:hypothetical protein